MTRRHMRLGQQVPGSTRRLVRVQVAKQAQLHYQRQREHSARSYLQAREQPAQRQRESVHRSPPPARRVQRSRRWPAVQQVPGVLLLPQEQR